MYELLFRAKFVFNKKLPKFIEKAIIREYERLRPYAVDALNPHYDGWNTNFGVREVDINDRLYDYGGTDYCNYIVLKAKEVIKQVNKDHPSSLITLDVDKIGDVIARCKFAKDVVMHLYLIPVKEES